MTSTSSRYADYVNAANKATTYALVNGTYIVGERNPDAQAPAGGVSSTAADMAKWLQMELADGSFNGAQVVDAQALQTSRVPHMTNSAAKQPDVRSGLYGLGTGVGTDAAGRVRYNHSGGFQLGAATVINLLPSAGLGIAVLSNSTPQGTPEAIAESFYDIVETGQISRDWNEAYGQVMTKQFLTNTSLAGWQTASRRRRTKRTASRPGRHLRQRLLRGPTGGGAQWWAGVGTRPETVGIPSRTGTRIPTPSRRWGEHELHLGGRFHSAAGWRACDGREGGGAQSVRAGHADPVGD